MREIKFRSWDKDDKTMFEDVDVLRNGAIIYFEVDEYGESPTHWYSNYGESYEEDFVNKFVVMQYTGLRDKIGKEIYEGDILQFSGRVAARGVVKYNESLCCFQACHNMSCWLICKESGVEVEVIGNIYENPDLVN